MKIVKDDATEEEDSPRVRRPPSKVSARLTVLFAAGRASDLAWDLGGLDVVVIGRTSSQLAVELPNRLELKLDDRKLSSTHFQIRQRGEDWLLEDAGSRNGTRVDGAATTTTTLEGGELIEAGRSLFLFEKDVPRLKVTEDTPPSLRTAHAGFAVALDKLAALAPSRISLLLLGETGTGKEVLAGAIHELSARKGDFVPVNCGAIPRTLLESELFGAKRGAFSGATEDRDGLVRASDKGTLFLDEIGDLPLDAQASLLRVLQESAVTPVGGTKPIKVDLRVLSATHRDLAAMVKREQFRADLFARLNGFTLSLPPLRERLADLGRLIATLAERHAGRERAASLEFTAAAQMKLATWPWTENVRELDKTLAAAIVLARGEPLDVEHLSLFAHEDDAVDDRPADTLRSALTRHRGNLTALAEELSTSRAQLHRLLKRHGLNPNDFRGR